MSVAAVLGCAVVDERALPGGDLSSVTRVTLADGRTAIAKRGPRVHAEAAMLRAIAATGVPTPAVLGEADALLVMADVPADGGEAWDDLAAILLRLHAAEGDDYGWGEDYAFGPVGVANTPCADWPRFWADARLRCHLPHLPADLAGRVERLADALPDHLPARPRPSLLHGDLWGGNILVARGRVSALIDPACYHGDREVDLAMLTLFDAPPERFLAACEPQPGWRARLPVYRLWPLLVHLRLFGDGYRGRVEADLARTGC